MSNSSFEKQSIAFFVGLAALAIFLVPTSADQTAIAMSNSVIQRGEKAFQSVGDCVRRSGLIVVGEYRSEGKIFVKEVLKGEASWTGKTIELKAPIVMGCREQPVPSIKSVAVLLQKNWSQSPTPVVEIYDEADQISLLECLTPILNNRSEHAKFVALSELFVDRRTHCKRAFAADPQPLFRQEFLSAIKQMQEPANFEIVKRLYSNARIDAKAKSDLLRWMAETGDSRAIAVLIDSLSSKDSALQSEAASNLMFYYPGEKGVDAALEHILKTVPQELAASICNYLAKRGHKMADAPKSLPTQTLFQKAEELDSKGEAKEAATIYTSILQQSSETNAYIIRTACLKALRGGNGDVKSRVLQSRLAWLSHDAASGNYLEVADTAEILRQLHDERCVDALITILGRREFMFAKANRIATMAIVQLGARARQKAIEALVKEVNTTKQLSNDGSQQIRLLLELAWIGKAQDLEAASKVVAANAGWSSSWKQMQPLLPVGQAADEGQFLIHALQSQHSLPQDAIDWIIYRLGDLHEHRASDLLVECFQKCVYSSPQTISDALLSISGERVAHRIELLSLNSHAPCQANAIDLLCQLKQAKALPVVREVVKTGRSEAKMHAINALAWLGTPDDLQMLLPMSDYWSGDRINHYWLMQAIASICQRFNCNKDGSRT